MSVRDVRVPERQDGEVLIRVGYAGVNPSDSKALSGQSARAGYRHSRSSLPDSLSFSESIRTISSFGFISL
jgi:NADPH:quinone reductase-like Zn-dependent oxidoreductase